MAFQGERVPGDLEMVESMAQDEIPEQDISVQEQFPPPPNRTQSPGWAQRQRPRCMTPPLPTSVKVPPQPPANPCLMIAKRPPQTHLMWASY